MPNVVDSQENQSDDNQEENSAINSVNSEEDSSYEILHSKMTSDNSSLEQDFSEDIQEKDNATDDVESEIKTTVIKESMGNILNSIRFDIKSFDDVNNDAVGTTELSFDNPENDASNDIKFIKESTACQRKNLLNTEFVKEPSDALETQDKSNDFDFAKEISGGKQTKDIDYTLIYDKQMKDAMNGINFVEEPFKIREKGEFGNGIKLKEGLYDAVLKKDDVALADKQKKYSSNEIKLKEGLPEDYQGKDVPNDSKLEEKLCDGEQRRSENERKKKENVALAGEQKKYTSKEIKLKEGLPEDGQGKDVPNNSKLEENLCDGEQRSGAVFIDVNVEKAANRESKDSSSSYETISTDSETSDEERAECIQSVIHELFANEKYHLLDMIGSGTFGDVYRVRDSDKNTDFAMKIIPECDQSDDEMTLWPLLKHSNVVPLLEVLHLQAGIVCVMPLLKASLFDVINKTDFCEKKSSWKKVKVWFHQILSGLEYMHRMRICHLDLKSDNVLLSEEQTASICDFSCVKSLQQDIESGGLPSIYRPPEAQSNLEDEPLDGVAFDQWSFGMMAFEILTDSPVSDEVASVTSTEAEESSAVWVRDVYPVLFRELQENNFKHSVRNSFPKATLGKKECRRARDFVLTFLRPNPALRWPAARAKRHAFLGRGLLRLDGVSDDEWVKKVDKFPIYARPTIKNKIHENINSEFQACQDSKNTVIIEISDGIAEGNELSRRFTNINGNDEISTHLDHQSSATNANSIGKSVCDEVKSSINLNKERNIYSVVIRKEMQKKADNFASNKKPSFAENSIKFHRLKVMPAIIKMGENVPAFDKIMHFLDKQKRLNKIIRIKKRCNKPLEKKWPFLKPEVLLQILSLNIEILKEDCSLRSDSIANAFSKRNSNLNKSGDFKAEIYPLIMDSTELRWRCLTKKILEAEIDLKNTILCTPGRVFQRTFQPEAKTVKNEYAEEHLKFQKETGKPINECQCEPVKGDGIDSLLDENPKIPMKIEKGNETFDVSPAEPVQLNDSLQNIDNLASSKKLERSFGPCSESKMVRGNFGTLTTSTKVPTRDSESENINKELVQLPKLCSFCYSQQNAPQPLVAEKNASGNGKFNVYEHLTKMQECISVLGKLTMGLAHFFKHQNCPESNMAGDKVYSVEKVDETAADEESLIGKGDD